MLDLGAKPFDVVVEYRTREYIRREVAVAALRPAERHGKVQSERHEYDYRLSPENCQLLALSSEQ